MHVYLVTVTGDDNQHFQQHWKLGFKCTEKYIDHLDKVFLFYRLICSNMACVSIFLHL